MSVLYTVLHHSTWFGLRPYDSPKGPFPFSKDPNISDAAGNPLHEHVSYVPTALLHYRMPSWAQWSAEFFSNAFSSAMFERKATVLSNYFLGREMYRFHYAGAWGPSATILIAHSNGKTHVQGQHFTYDPSIFTKDPSEGGDPPTILTSDRDLDATEWNQFKDLLAACNYWYMLPHLPTMGVDGASWFMEGHREDGYWYVWRWCPRGPFEACGRYLFALCNFPQVEY